MVGVVIGALALVVALRGLLLVVSRIRTDWYTRHSGDLEVVVELLLTLVSAPLVWGWTRLALSASVQTPRLLRCSIVHPTRLETSPGPTGLVVHHVAGVIEVDVETVLWHEER